MGAAVGSLLARAPLLVKPWGDAERGSRWLYAEAWLLGACMVVGVIAIGRALLE